MNAPMFSTVQQGSVPAHFIGLSAHEKEQQKLSAERQRLFANNKQIILGKLREYDCTLGWPVVKGGV